MKAIAWTIPYSMDMVSSTIAISSSCVLAEMTVQAASDVIMERGRGEMLISISFLLSVLIYQADENLMPTVLSIHFLTMNLPILVKSCTDGTGEVMSLIWVKSAEQGSKPVPVH